MAGTSLHFARSDGGGRFDDSGKARRASPRSTSRPTASGSPEKHIGSDKPLKNPAAAGSAPSSNLDRFLESTTPLIPAQYFSKMSTRGWRGCDVEQRPHFLLSDLWEYFKEWSAYGAGVPLILNSSDCAVQYYVPYLSGIELYSNSLARPDVSRKLGEDSDSDCYRDSSSDGSSDCELLEASSNDDSDSENNQGRLLFQYLERDPPYSREPLADKIFDLARSFPQLKTSRSCDLLPASWISVAWYPIYRIPTGPSLKDLDACFLTFHSLSTPATGGTADSFPTFTYANEMSGVPKISLRSFGLASYKFKGSLWTPSGGCEKQLASSLLQAADNWLRLLNVDHPDYRFFTSRATFRR